MKYNLHRNRRYFVIKLHTWFCLSYFLRTNIKLYCIYQQFFQHHICFPIANETSHVTTHAQWPKENVPKDKQRSTKHTHKTKDRVTRTPLKTGDEFMCSGRVSSSCSTSGTRRVNIVTNPVISREWGKDQEVSGCIMRDSLFIILLQLSIFRCCILRHV
jgi:hypothetical protein